MEEFAFLEQENCTVEGFSHATFCVPNEKSFEICLGFGFLQCLLLARNARELTYENFSSNLLYCTEENYIRVSVCQFIEAAFQKKTENLITWLHTDMIKNDSNIINSFYQLFNEIIVNNFLTNTVTQDLVENISNFFGIYLAIYEKNQIVYESRNENFLPAVYLIRKNLRNLRYMYGILFHENFNYFEEIQNINCYPFLAKYDGNLRILNQKKNNLMKLFSKIAEICEKNKEKTKITESKFLNFKQRYLKSKFVNPHSEKILKYYENLLNSKKTVRNMDYLITGDKKCLNCDQKLIKTFPIDLKCTTHPSCLSCMVHNYRKNLSIVCQTCNREYDNSELSLILSLVDD